MQSKEVFRYSAIAVIACVVVVNVVYATNLTWVATMADDWDNPDNWSGEDEFPEDGDKAIQDDTTTSHIIVTDDEHCDDIEGDGDSAGRYLVVESEKELEVDADVVGT